MESEAAGRFRGAVELAGDGFGELSARVHEFHRAVSDIPFARLAAIPGVADASRPIRLVHDGVTDAIYKAVRVFGAALFGVASALLRSAERRGRSVEPGDATPNRAALLSALNGAVGDHLAARRNPLALRAGFYHRGQRLALTTEGIAAAHPRASRRIAIFVHGLCCNESVWEFYRREGDPSTVPYGERLAEEHGFTPFYFRYNSGLHVSQSGRALAALVKRLALAHPVPVEEIVLVGHSMGGLVARSACHLGHRRREAWAERVSHVICLGSPHLGAPLEKAVHLGTMILGQFDLGRPFARVIDRRSLGIQDLRHGFVAAADWRRRLADDVPVGLRTPIPRHPRTRYHFIGCVLGGSPRDPLSLVAGDGLVRLPSSTARELADAGTAVVFRRHHLRLLNDPEVYAEIVSRLGLPATPDRA